MPEQVESLAKRIMDLVAETDRRYAAETDPLEASSIRGLGQLLAIAAGYAAEIDGESGYEAPMSEATLHARFDELARQFIEIDPPDSATE